MGFVPLLVRCATAALGIFAASAASTNTEDSLLRQKCENDIQWKGSSLLRERCSEATGWRPNDLLWTDFLHKNKPITIEDEDGEHGKDQRHNLESCMDAAAVNKLTNDGSIDSSDKPPTIVRTHTEKETGQILLAEVANAITKDQAYAVSALARCTRKYVGDNNFQKRDFDSGGGNDCTYIHMLLQLFLPSVAARIQRVNQLAYREVGWVHNGTLRAPETLGLRTSEYLSYKKFTDGLGSHGDTGSVYTVIFALTDPKEYGGGEFYLELEDDDGEETKYHFKPEQV